MRCGDPIDPPGFGNPIGCGDPKGCEGPGGRPTGDAAATEVFESGSVLPEPSRSRSTSHQSWAPAQTVRGGEAFRTGGHSGRGPCENESDDDDQEGEEVGEEGRGRTSNCC